MISVREKIAYGLGGVITEDAKERVTVQSYRFVFGMLGVVLFLLCFIGTKERVSPPENQTSSMKESLQSLWKNDQCRILCVASFYLLTGQVLRLTLAVYYVKYFLGRDDLITPFLTLGIVASMLGCAVAQPLAKRVCKIKAYVVLQSLSAAICLFSFLISPDQIILAFVAFIAWKFLLDMATPLLWAKMADTIDYGHKKQVSG